ncbi:MAG: TolC family protein, partial [Myxococcota bacterium]
MTRPVKERVRCLRTLARSGAVALLALLPLLGCALAPGQSGEDKARAALPGSTAIAGEWTTPEWDTGDVDDGWIAAFRDPQLDALVDEAIANNPNLRVAGARVERAEGFVQLAQAGLQPTVGVGAETAQVGGTEIPGATTRQGGLVVAWEADVWGRIRAGIDASEQGLAAAKADYNGARLSLAAQTARAWFLAQELRMQVRLAQQQVSVLGEIVGVVRKNFQVGRVARADVNLAEADLAGAENALRQVRMAETQTVRLLELLLGRYPAASLETSGRLVAVPPRVPAGMPSELLERRPDLVAAERRVAQAFRMEEQARLAQLPRFT